MLDNVALKDLLSKSGDARRGAEGGAKRLPGRGRTSPGMSRDERAAGVPCHRCRPQACPEPVEGSVRYCSTRDDDAELREKLRELGNQRRRFGYRRLHILLRREGVMINGKKIQRLYKEESLAVRRRRSRRRAVGTRAPAAVLALPNQR